MSSEIVSRRRHTWLGAATGVLCGLIILGPALAPGYVWLYDMIFVPHLPLSAHTLGIDGSIPRAVPSDAVVSVLSMIVPGSVVQKTLILLAFVVVGSGCARFCMTWPGAVAAALAACWNPFVAERLVIGHWGFLLGYATLPWIFAAVMDWRRGDDRQKFVLLGWLAMASLAGSTAAIIAFIAATIALCAPGAGQQTILVGLKRTSGIGVLMVALNASWLVTSFGLPGGVPADPAGVEAFAARADTPLGLWPSLFTLGGIWHSPSWPDSRSLVTTVGFALVILLALIVGGIVSRAFLNLAPMAIAGIVGLSVAGMTAFPGGEQLASWIVTDVPGGGIIRDSQKFVMLFAVLMAVLAGAVVDRLVELHATSSAELRKNLFVIAAVVIVAAPVVTLPDAAWGVGGRIRVVALADDVNDTQHFFDHAPEGGVAVFPWTLYRRFEWNGNRVSLDPWNRLLSRRVLVNDDLKLSTTTVKGEDPSARAIADQLARGGDQLGSVLRAQGARWVILLTDQPEEQASRQLLDAGGLDKVGTFGDIDIYDAGQSAKPAGPSSSKVPIFISLLTAIICVVLGFGSRQAGGRRELTPS